MEKIKFLALGGLDESGRNLSIVEVEDEIYVIEAGIKYPNSEQLGVEVVLPDFTYLKNNKERIKAIIITQGHEDVMGAIPYMMRQIKAPIYTTPLIALMIEDKLRAAKVKGTKIFKIKRDSKFKIGSRSITTFGVTHSIPDSFGIAILTDQGYIVHASEFMIDFNSQDPSFSMDLSRISDIGKKGVFMLIAESSYAKRKGFTSPLHRIDDRLERAFEATEDRVIVSLYDQNIFRLMEIIDTARKFGRKVYFHSDKQRRLLEHLKSLSYYTLPEGIEIEPKSFNNDEENVVVIVAGVGPQVFHTMTRIATGEDNKVMIRDTDSVIIASPEVPGTEAEAGVMVDELFKDGVALTTMSYKEVFAMHASIEDLKMMISLLKPKYYIPVKGEYQDLVANADVASDMGIKPSNIVILDNGQIADFQEGRLKTTSEIIKLEDVLIDGKAHLDTTGLVLRDRQILANDGALIIGMMISQKTKQILGGPDVQSRGLIYLKDADGIVAEIGNILEKTITTMVAEKRYSNIDARNEARDGISKYIFKQTGKRPMVLPVIIEIKAQ